MSILVAVGSRSDQHPAIETGHDLASAYETDLHALHAVSQEEFEERKATVEESGAFDGYSKSQRADAAANVANRAVVDTLDSPDFDAISTHGRVGDPVREILDVADEVGAEYIVIGGRRRSPTGKALFGSTTQSVLLNADRPVVTVMGDE